MEQGKVHQEVTGKHKSNFSKYKTLYLGNIGFGKALLFELIILFFSNMPGALGLAFRKIFYPAVFKKVGKNVIFGRGITLRHPVKITIGDNAVIEDNCVLDAKGEQNQGIRIGDGVILSRNTVLSCKDGDISIGSNTVIGINSVIHALKGSNVFVGQDVLISAYVYIIGGGNYSHSRTDMPIRQQGLFSKGGISIDDNVWIGASTNITDGVSIASGNIIGAYSLVNRPIKQKDYISFGIPAKPRQSRVK